MQGDSPFVVTVPAQWLAFARFAKDTLGCRFFSFSTAVDWKEDGLEVVARVDNLDDGVVGVDEDAARRRVSRRARRSCRSIAAPTGWSASATTCSGFASRAIPTCAAFFSADDWVGHPALKSYAVDTPHPPYR